MLDTAFDAQPLLRAYRTYEHLTSAPPLMGHIVAQVTPSMQVQASDGSQHTKASHGRLPLRDTPLDDADELYDRLSYWSMFFARHLHVEPPVHLLHGFDSGTDVAGLPAYALRVPERAVLLTATVVYWLQEYATTIAGTTKAELYDDDIHQLLQEMQGRYPTAPPPEHRYLARPCHVCGEKQVRVFWTDAEDGPQVLKLRCRNCRNIVPVTDLAEYLAD